MQGGSRYIELGCLYRWHGTTKSQFREHYLDVHSVLGRQVPGLIWYSVCIPAAADEASGAPLIPDSYTFCAYESEAAYERAQKTAHYAASVRDHEGFFGYAEMSVVDRHEIVPVDGLDPNDYVQLTAMYRRPGATQQEFREHYEQTYANLVAGLPGLKWCTAYLVQEHGRDERSGPPAPDAFTLHSYASAEAFNHARATPEGVRARDEEDRFCAHMYECAVERLEFTQPPSPRALNHDGCSFNSNEHPFGSRETATPGTSARRSSCQGLSPADPHFCSQRRPPPSQREPAPARGTSGSFPMPYAVGTVH
jgi:EthD domain